jgi:hypothetical protein
VLVEVLAGAEPEAEASCESNCTVAAFCATTAGWYRIVGQVTYVISGMREVACAAAPSTLHTYGE